MRKVMATLFALLLSTGAGATVWEYIPGYDGSPGSNCLKADPAHGRLLIGVNGGYRIYDPVAGEWLVRELQEINDVYSVLPHPTDSDFLLTGRYGGFFYGWIEDDAGLVAQGPIVHSGTFGTVTGLGRLPGDEDTLFACSMFSEAPGGIYRSQDAGQTWTTVHPFSWEEAGMTLTVGPGGDVLVGTGIPSYPGVNDGILRSSDAGATWTEISGDMVCASFVGQIEVDPLDAQHIYAAQGGTWEPDDPALGVWETLDGGGHWTQILAGNVLDLCMDPLNGDVLVALRGAEVLLTRNGGATWVDIGDGLPYGATYCAVLPTDDRIYVATYDGLYATAASPTAVADAQAATLALGAAPNPFNPATAISFSLPAAARATLTVHDAQGRQVRRLLADAARPAGRQQVIWDGRDDAGHALPSGLYLARVTALGRSEAGKLVLLK